MFQDLHKGPWEAETASSTSPSSPGPTGVKYFMISYTDLFGGQRAKLVPAQAIADMQVEGAGFAGFATWLDLTPGARRPHGDPRPASVIQLPWKPEVAWVAADCHHGGRARRPGARATSCAALIAEAAKEGLRVKTGVEPEFFLLTRRRQRDLGPPRHRREALLRPAGGDAALRRHRRDLRLHAGAGLGGLPERPRGRDRPVRDELEVRRRPAHRRQAQLLQVHGASRSPRSTGCARPSCPSPSRASPGRAATPTSRSGTSTARPTPSPTTARSWASRTRAAPSWAGS